MKIFEALKLLKELENSSFANAFLSCMLDVDTSYLVLNANKDINEDEFLKLVNLYKNGTPFEYIFKSASFYGLDFYVDERVLIPRFDSEILLDNAINLINEKNIQNVLEIGFGSGALSIMLAKLTKAKIKACDISSGAYSVAMINKQKHKSDVEFFIDDFMNVDFTKFDMIFSNPPYIANDYKLDKYVLNEPHVALFGGEVGDELLKKIIQKSAKSGVKFIACEFGYDQKQSLENELLSCGYEGKFYKDFGGFDRAFVAYKN